MLSHNGDRRIPTEVEPPNPNSRRALRSLAAITAKLRQLWQQMSTELGISPNRYRQLPNNSEPVVGNTRVSVSWSVAFELDAREAIVEALTGRATADADADGDGEAELEQSAQPTGNHREQHPRVAARRLLERGLALG